MGICVWKVIAMHFHENCNITRNKDKKKIYYFLEIFLKHYNKSTLDFPLAMHNFVSPYLESLQNDSIFFDIFIHARWSKSSADIFQTSRQKFSHVKQLPKLTTKPSKVKKMKKIEKIQNICLFVIYIFFSFTEYHSFTI